MTSSKYRGKGIFTKMGNYSTGELASSVPFTMGYPIRKEVIPGHLKVGWKVVLELPLHIKILKINSLLAKYKAGFLAPFVNIFVYLVNAALSLQKSGKLKCEIIDRIDEIKSTDYDLFFSSWSKDKPNFLIKSVEFLKWRLGAPGKDYKIVVFRDDSELVCMVITRFIVKEGVPSLAILDFMILPKHYKYLGFVHNQLSEFALKGKAETILTMCSRDWAKKYKFFPNGYLISP